ncbi:MFS transporter [Francisella sp. LA112445]|uniref:MFS transporter n=1 Tax=Francisella sp. LA112445 TaxID=1395624 RepID=UPI001788AB86|nr:MFS transporter [Francisella sp. LA112445]QIW09226.1 multidrug effflux MFS transporter [Francisella sp. LA112445]
MRNYKIIILLSYIGLASGSAAILNPALPYITREYGLSKGAVEWIVTAFLIGYVVGLIIYGPIAKKYGGAKTLRIGMIINIIGIIICLLASKDSSMFMLATGRFVTAVGASAGLACVFLILNQSLAPHKVKFALSFATVSFTLAITIATLIGGVITTYSYWSYCFYVLLLQAVIMFGMSFLYENKKDAGYDLKVSAIVGGYLEAFKSYKLIVFSLAIGSMSVFSYCYSASGPFMAHSLFNFSSAEYSIWTSMTMIGILSGSIIIAKIINKYESENILIIALICLIILIVVLAVLKVANSLTPVIFFVLITLMYFVCNFIFPTGSHIASNAIECKANGSAAMNFINMLTAVVGVTAMGYVPFEYIWSFLLLSAILPVVCLVLIAINKRISQS